MQTSNFQVIVLGICGTLLLIGIGIFASFGGLLGGKSVGKVVVWGTVEQESMRTLLEALRVRDKSFENVSYVEKDAATYRETLVNAMAGGAAPDLFLLPGGDLGAFNDKVLIIPYSAVSQTSFADSYIDEGQLFSAKGGVYALPFSIDPLVMYWNRDLFAGAGIASPPKYWNDFLAIAPKITSLDSGSNVKKSAVALGEWRNIAHAKEILSTLFMQSGDPIVALQSDGKPVVVLGTNQSGGKENPAESALRFYTDFANPSKTSYSWNRALPESTDAFISGDLAAYFGFASEYPRISERNPNLRFSVASVPQIGTNVASITFGHMTGLAIPRGANNSKGALTIAQRLTSKEGSIIFSQISGLPSVRRDVVVDASANAAAEVFAQSALISRAWPDPSSEATDALFKTMIESVVSGKNQSSQAISEAAQEFIRLVPR